MSTAFSTQESPSGLGRRIADAALALGFAKVGFAPADRFEEAGERHREWLARGHAGEMAYLDGDERADPATLLDDAKSIVVVALPYPSEPGEGDRRHLPLVGEVARYARGRDYHDVMREKLRSLAKECSRLVGREVGARVCVDTAPLLEREAARRAGVGFVGKSTLAIVPGIGTYFVLGEIVLDVEIEPSETVAPGCGSCRACLDACPTGAFVGPHVLDARRCISYLTIELRGPIPVELRPLVGKRVFGCDVCQDVCPFNASAARRETAPELAPRAELTSPDLIALLDLGAAGYRKFVKKSALRRATRQQLARNAAVALGNAGDRAAVPALAKALSEHRFALVRRHAAWALGRLGGDEARRALEAAASGDWDPDVRGEALAALGGAG